MRTVFIPLSRLKLEDGELQVPYSVEHLTAGPEIEATDELSEDDEGALRAYYSVGVGDGELTTDNFSYATLVPEEDGRSKRVAGRRSARDAERRQADRRDPRQAR